MELSSKELAEFGRAAVEAALQSYTASDTRPIFPSDRERAQLLRADAPLPLDGAAWQDVLREFQTSIEPGCRNNAHPLMAGYVVSAGTWTGALGDFLASTLNQNVTSWRSSPSGTVLEHLVVRWIGEMLGYSDNAQGLLVSGGSMANFTALAAALQSRVDVDLGKDGVRALDREPVFYASALVHLSISKALSLLGVGSRALRVVPHDADGRLSVAALESAIHHDRQAGRLPVAVIANAGDVNTGAVDDMVALAETCAREALWLHVDAAYGGFAALAPSTRSLFAGISSADSVSVDAHKWLSVPVDAGCLLVKDMTTLAHAFSHGAAYVQVLEQAPLESFAFFDYGPELSRRFRALKIWFTLKAYGSRAIGTAVEQNIQAARALGDAVRASVDFELLAPVGLSIVCFRYVPQHIKPRLTGGAQVEARERELDELNRAIAHHVQRGGRAYLSNASLGGKFALRACFANHRTTPEHALGLLDIVRESGERLAAAS